MKHSAKATYGTIERISCNILSSESFLWQVATVAFLGLPVVDLIAIVNVPSALHTQASAETTFIYKGNRSIISRILVRDCSALDNILQCIIVSV
jgi:hypothetical protein